MKQVVTAAGMREYEGRLINEYGVDSLLLMERAALALAEEALKSIGGKKRALVVCGGGNNGGDGLAAARFLAESDVALTVLIAGDMAKASDACRKQVDIAEKMGIRISTDTKLLEEDYELCIDACLGTGLSREVTGNYAEAVKGMNALKARGCRIISADIPSGLSSDEGIGLGDTVYADKTVCFGAVKQGMLINKGREYCGELKIRPIGVLKELPGDSFLLEASDLKDFIPKRKRLGHKGTFGKILFITGSPDMPGAAILSAKAALSCGAGMVKVFGPLENRPVCITAVPEAMYSAADISDAKTLREELDWCDAVVAGCGLGKERAAGLLKSEAFRSFEGPVVLDADCLNALSDDKSYLEYRKKPGLFTVLTPHPAEYSRLFGTEGKLQSPEEVRSFAAEYGAVIAAKSATTIVSDGQKLWFNTCGNDGMATAGSGDVLAGIMGALLTVSEDKSRAAAGAVLLHACGGDKAAERLGRHGVTAAEIIKGAAQCLKETE